MLYNNHIKGIFYITGGHIMTRHEWQVWIESENENSEIVFTIVFE